MTTVAARGVGYHTKLVRATGDRFEDGVGLLGSSWSSVAMCSLDQWRSLLSTALSSAVSDGHRQGNGLDLPGVAALG